MTPQEYQMVFQDFGQKRAKRLYDLVSIFESLSPDKVKLDTSEEWALFAKEHEVSLDQIFKDLQFISNKGIIEKRHVYYAANSHRKIYAFAKKLPNQASVISVCKNCGEFIERLFPVIAD